MDEIKGRDCSCSRTNLKYLLRANLIMASYLPPGVINEGIKAKTIITIPTLSGITFQSVILGGTTYTNGTSSASTTIALGKINTLVNNTGTYTSTVSGNIITIYSPVGDYNGTIATIELGQPPATPEYLGQFDGGQFTQEEGDNCLTDAQATQIIENLGGLCSCNPCSDFYTDVAP